MNEKQKPIMLFAQTNFLNTLPKPPLNIEALFVGKSISSKAVK